ncbi:hypothetical protein AMK68_03490, partial [candidate division KD3-62 bacterium DG_56]
MVQYDLAWRGLEAEGIATMAHMRSALTTGSTRDLAPTYCFLRELPPEARQLVAETTRVRMIPRHKLVARQGEPVVGLNCLLRGILRCWQTDVDGNDYTVETAWSDSVSIVALGGPDAEWPWNVTTIVPATVATMNWDCLKALRRRYPLDEVLMQYAAADYSRRHVWHGLLRSVRLRPRLRMVLRRISDEMGTATDQGIRIRFPLTHS